MSYPCSAVASRCLREGGGALSQPPKDIIKARKCHWGLETRALGESVLQTCFVQHIFYFPFPPSSPTSSPRPALCHCRAGVARWLSVDI